MNLSTAHLLSKNEVPSAGSSLSRGTLALRVGRDSLQNKDGKIPTRGSQVRSTLRSVNTPREAISQRQAQVRDVTSFNPHNYPVQQALLLPPPLVRWGN